MDTVAPLSGLSFAILLSQDRTGFSKRVFQFAEVIGMTGGFSNFGRAESKGSTRKKFIY